ncbi:50S ribosomal protein L11 methyltransferase [Snodgrassella sp. B3882]|uniref:50S ribosomal protein L11 methyltransferase n=1 Tax=Snodgrassella sp. B3882 TaxID=2818037 RepID=UPI00226AD3E6|nr:50S ribosomal protein L11 methyltransferase [Snodgrassella sp. B3882]MCX8744364.1 50S ribosomal protein L11 methyltransferase [Snodgrassella sp. B3882]
MHYQQVVITVPQDQVDVLSDALIEHGALSTAIEDANAGQENEQPIFGEPDMPTEEVWQQSNIVALFDQNSDIDLIVKEAAQACTIAVPSYCLETVQEQDWVRLTQSQFEPIQISDRLWITPSWHSIPNASDIINLQLDPGLAFGTGSHPTTHLCLQWLDQNIHGGEKILDYGCGSGILTIAALKLGAQSATGVDIDRQAIRASQDNALNNQVEAQFFLPDDLPENEQYDIVVANILANPLRLLAQMLAERTRTGGQIVLSGILAEQTEELSSIYAQWFDLNQPKIDDGWVCISGTKKA